MINTLLWVSLLVVILNIPFGYWRINVSKYSWRWMLAVHLPVPFIVALRFFSAVGFAWYTYVFLVASFFIGQQIGGYFQLLVKQNCRSVSSCMVMDLYRCSRN